MDAFTVSLRRRPQIDWRFSECKYSIMYTYTLTKEITQTGIE